MATNKKKSKAKTAAKPKAKAKVKAAVKSKAPAKAKISAKAKAPAKAKASMKAKATAKAKAPATAKVSTPARTSAGAVSGPQRKIEWSRVITPIEDRIVISVHKPEEKTAGGIIIPGAGSERPNKGTVLAVGSGRRNKKGQVRPLDVKVGDEVIFADFAGTKVDVDGEEVLVLREDELLGIATQ